MNIKKESKYSTKGYPILCLGSHVLAKNALIKVWFNSKYYYISRAKCVKQTIDNIAKQIRTGLNKGGFPETHLFYHMVKKIKTVRYLNAEVELIKSELKPLELIKEEQLELDKANGDIYCLNNNEQAYVPIGNQLLTEKEKEQFLIWYEKTRKK